MKHLFYVITGSVAQIKACSFPSLASCLYLHDSSELRAAVMSFNTDTQALVTAMSN